MYKAGGQKGDGSRVVVLGLTYENLKNLRNGRSVKFPLSEIGFGPGEVLIFAGPSEQDMADLVNDINAGLL